MNDLVHETNASPRQEQRGTGLVGQENKAQEDAAADGNKFQARKDAPGHMGLISENHPGMTAEMPACSSAPAAAAPSGANSTASPLSHALLAAASASILQRRGGRRSGGESRRTRWPAGGGRMERRADNGAALRLGLPFRSVWPLFRDFGLCAV
jgi:hypothetical protein